MADLRKSSRMVQVSGRTYFRTRSVNSAARPINLTPVIYGRDARPCRRGRRGRGRDRVIGVRRHVPKGLSQGYLFGRHRGFDTPAAVRRIYLGKIVPVPSQHRHLATPSLRNTVPLQPRPFASSRWPEQTTRRQPAVSRAV